ncbi:MAG: NUDIX hydrolase [Alphaproteobacteria bacterium]
MCLVNAKHYCGEVSEHAVILNEHGEILILRHAGKGNPSLQGKMHLPGGRLDMDDPPGSALLREIEEETGLTDIELILPCSATRWGFQDPIKYSVTYLAITKGRPTPVLPADEDHEHAEWLPHAKVVAGEFISSPTMNQAVAEVLIWAKKLGYLPAA